MIGKNSYDKVGKTMLSDAKFFEQSLLNSKIKNTLMPNFEWSLLVGVPNGVIFKSWI